ncbi:acetoacetyl-CoA reductase [Gallaecimonas pentaromativorans]|uniref:3-oxoacyl-[acyl-carrier-protein] reductase n=1 Tax=Gallaecimonas pentaromativorans TaxID=584787 RepID=A0A3N1PFZ1_9GAMM|nr:acetoacetyl-CoA reductase [Gallaecimonas pentaromativorans]MED5526593.1 acetoacetyl-CoA reductase [Pseudomonadota bacterium]ROQ25927.1 3-oxoacyl-[acyl-carrier-protein] reductase [Gallaecimonas pentaromativorans]
MDVQGQVALVTGANGGIGTAICRALAKEGYKVATLCRCPEKAARWVEQEKALGFDPYLVLADICDQDGVFSAISVIEKELGPLSVVVNNAGITRDKTLRKMMEDDWLEVIQTNLTGAYHLCRAAVPQMLEHKYGRIINISSINGEKGQLGQTNYSAAKAGLHGLTMALAQEVANKGITVNTISPGYIATEMVMAVPEEIRNSIIAQIPVGRLGDPAEIARIVAFLASPESGFITGSNISANGGQHMH